MIQPVELPQLAKNTRRCFILTTIPANLNEQLTQASSRSGDSVKFSRTIWTLATKLTRSVCSSGVGVRSPLRRNIAYKFHFSVNFLIAGCMLITNLCQSIIKFGRRRCPGKEVRHHHRIKRRPIWMARFLIVRGHITIPMYFHIHFQRV